MAENLTNRHIYETYHSLIKTGDNLPIDGTLKVLSDGDGNELPIEVSEEEVKFKEGSSVDFTDVTIIGGEGFQGPQGATGPQGPQGQNGSNGAQGSQGPQGSNGSNGAQGAQGPQGQNGSNGVQGAQGPQGQNGSNGVQGAQGPQGFQGTGVQGAQGPQGENGTNGAQGFQGPDAGIAVNDIERDAYTLTGTLNQVVIGTFKIPANTVRLNNLYRLQITVDGVKTVSANTNYNFSMGTTEPTVGGTPLINLVNFTSAAPAAVGTTSTRSVLGRTLSVSNIGPLSAAATQYQIVSNNDITSISQTPIAYTTTNIDWTVDQWVQITGALGNVANSTYVSWTSFTSINGAGTGQNGAQGATGAQGVQGPIGPQGFQGFQGTGVQGATGAQGPQGFQGIAGTNGAQGAQGPQGFQGNNGISSGAVYYFNQSQSSDIAPYKVLSINPTGTAQQTITTALTGSQQNVKVGNGFITSQLGFAAIPGGTQRFHLHYLKQAQNDRVEAYATIQLANSTGTPIGPIIQTGLSLVGWVDAATPAEVTLDLTLPTTGIDPTNRMIVNIYLNNNDNTSHSVIWYTEGTQYYAFVTTTVGVVGNQGPQGFQGPQGQNGSNGAQGAQGPQGDVGQTGVQGAQGPQGDVGQTGVQGAQGPQGNVGQTGAQGAQGPQGNVGQTGVQGAQGPQGFQGTQGPTNPNNITSTGPNTIAFIWEGTQAQYNALGTYSATTIYFIE